MRALSLSHKYGVSPRNSDSLGTVSISGLFAELNIHSVGQGWKLDRLEVLSKRSSDCTPSHVIVSGVTSVKQVDLWKYALRGTNITWHRICLKIKIRPTCLRRRPQNMLEWSKGLADWTRHHMQERQGIRPHVTCLWYTIWSDNPAWSPLPSGLPLSQQKSKNYNSVKCRSSGKFWFSSVNIIRRIHFSSDDFNLDSSLVQGLISMEILIF
jgi:hypothetical protein